MSSEVGDEDAEKFGDVFEPREHSTSEEDLPELIVADSAKDANLPKVVTGNRIVNLVSVIEKARELEKHV